MLKVFISWSEPKSKDVAVALRDWLPGILQAIKPWMSDKDILPGDDWSIELDRSLQNSDVGIICLTSENIHHSDWLNYEAGALSRSGKDDKKKRIIPYLYDCTYEDLPPPLKKYQPVKADKEGTRQMIVTLNGELEVSLKPDLLDKAFSLWWPELQKSLLPEPNIPSPKMENFALFLYGGPKNEKTPRSEYIFQDFIREDEQIWFNAVQWLWADALFGSRISAKIKKGQSILEISFENKVPFPCNRVST